MKIKVLVRPWRGSEQVHPDEATILVVEDFLLPDEKPGEVEFRHHYVFIEGTEIHCNGWKLGVEPNDVFANFTALNITHESWDRYLAEHGYDDILFDNSGRPVWDHEEGKMLPKWFPGASLSVSVTSLELMPMPMQVPA